MNGQFVIRANQFVRLANQFARRANSVRTCSPVLCWVLLGFGSPQVQAASTWLSPFKEPDGSTKWQYVANFSSSVLILSLLVVLGFLWRAHYRAKRSNRELTDIRATLEVRVQERTQSLAETTARLARREAYIQSIVHAMPVMLVGLNRQGAITQWNREAERITGRSADAVMGLPLWEAYPTIAITPQQVEKVLITGETTSLQHSQRGHYYFDLTLYALTGEEPDDTGVVLLIDDITKQIKAENKLVERNKMSAMGELATALAHDLSGPLAGLKASLHAMAQSTDLAAAAPSAFQWAVQACDQAEAQVQHLLGFAQSHSAPKATASVADILDQALSLAPTLYAVPQGLHFADIQIVRDFQPDVPPIACFAGELKQVFLRLLRHAFHALAARHREPDFVPQLRVEVANFYDSVWVKVQHNGQGLSPEEQQDIFEPFFSNAYEDADLDSPASPVEQRLSYSHFIVTDHHKGQIAVTSAQDIGTSFHIQLPLA
jgi:PAS domain S-box-containing protein